MAEYLQSAFDAVCKEAKQASGWYVALVERSSRYGGPEEGGWWTTDTHILAYQYYSTEEQAKAAKDAVEKLAEELKTEARKEFGNQCLREMDWCEERGLEPDYLPEPDGPSDYFVMMTEGFPQESRGPTHYE